MLELMLKNRHLAGAADIGGQSAGDRGIEPRGVIADRDEAMNRLLLAFALELEDTGRLAFDHALDLPQHGIAHDDAARGRLGLESRRKIDDVPMRGHASALAAVNRAEHHGTGRETDAKKRTMTELGFDAIGRLCKPVLNFERSAAGAQRTVFERGRRAKQSEDAIACKILDRTAMAMDRSGGQS